jgi:hypothetical protein
MDDAKLMKGRVIADFKQELKLKGFEKKGIYETTFLKVLNNIYDYGAKNILSGISRYKTLTFHLRFDHMHIYLEWNPEKKDSSNTLLNITDVNDFERGGTYYLTLERALLKINGVCRSKV